MIRWGEAWVLPWLWALVPLAGLLFFLAGRREKKLRILLADEAVAQLAPERRRARVRAKNALWLTACALALVALARPQWGIRWQEAQQRGLDILVVLDTSNSMLAPDLNPSRLARAKRRHAWPLLSGPKAPLFSPEPSSRTPGRRSPRSRGPSRFWRRRSRMPPSGASSGSGEPGRRETAIWARG